MHADDLVLQLGAVRPVAATEEAAAAAVAMGPRAARLLRANRTVGLAASRLGAAIDDETPFAREFAPHRDRLAQRVGMVHTSVELVAGLASDVDVRVYGMKGLAMRHLYPDPVDRDVRDVDLWVGDVDDAGRLAQALLRQGFRHDENELPWIKRGDGATYGQIRLSSPDDGLAPVDVHFGPYSVGHRGRLPLSAEGSVADGVLPRLAEAVNLRATLGNATGDCLVTTKDQNDYVLVMGRVSAVEWDEHVRLAARVAALRILRTILHRAAQTQHVDDVLLRRERALARVGVRPVRLERLPSARYRTRATVRRAAVQARRAGDGRLLASAVSAWRYYRHPLRLRTDPSATTPAVSSAASDRCLRLVPAHVVAPVPPAAPAAASALRRVPTPFGDLCSFAGVLHVPTVDYRLDPRLVGECATRSAGSTGAELDRT